jgi:hypothetical protein
MITGTSTEALFSQYELEKIIAFGPVNVIKDALKFVNIAASTNNPALSILTSVACEALDKAFPTGLGIDELCHAVILDITRHERNFEKIQVTLTEMFNWMASYGAQLTYQAARAIEITADKTKKQRIGRILVTGERNWPSNDKEQEDLRTQQISEFTRMAGILLDIDVQVLRSIYSRQKGIVEMYRKLTTQQLDPHARASIEQDWRNAVFRTWRETSFSEEGKPVAFLDILSALPRLEALGLVCPAYIQQTTGLEVDTTPFGLTDLGCRFVENSTVE